MDYFKTGFVNQYNVFVNQNYFLMEELEILHENNHMKQILIFFSLLIIFTSNAQEKPALPYGSVAGDDLTAYVHPGVELMAIVQILADKYPHPTPSVYAEEMKKYFTPFANHPAVEYIKSFKRNIYTDFIELGWCFDGFPNIALTEPTKENWFRNYGKDSVLNYLRLVKQFYDDTQFWKFYSAHETQYSEWAKDVRQKIKDSASFEKLYGFYKIKRPVNLYIGIEPLNNWGAHAIPSFAGINPKYNSLVAYETGYFNDTATKSGQPKFTMGTETIYDLLWHEGGHILIEGLMKKYAAEIKQLSYLYNGNDEGMKRSQIGNWEYCLNENIIRSVVACLKRQYKNYRQFEKTISKEDGGDFIFVNDLAPFIWKEYMVEKKYTDFETLFPVLLERLKKGGDDFVVHY
jgi:hypothetical protein